MLNVLSDDPKLVISLFQIKCIETVHVLWCYCIVHNIQQNTIRTQLVRDINLKCPFMS